MKRVCVAALVVALVSVSFSFIASAQHLDATEWRMVDLLNSYRMQNGLRPVYVSRTLTRASEFHSNWMADRDCFSHQCYREPDFGQRMQNAGYYWEQGAAENIAAGIRNAERTFRGWVNSPSHNDAMLDPRWRAVGISRAYNSDSRYRWYWTMDFGDVIDASIAMPETFGSALPSALSLNSAPINIQVYNLAGELIFESGWRNAADAQNLSFIHQRLANGVYLYTTQVQGQESRSALKKMVVLN